MEMLNHDDNEFNIRFPEAGRFIFAAKLRKECFGLGLNKNRTRWEEARFRSLLRAPACREGWFRSQLSMDMGLDEDDLDQMAGGQNG